jgi:hypothetical protein
MQTVIEWIANDFDGRSCVIGIFIGYGIVALLDYIATSKH